jgi:diguanylate cyclase (GGDEF)-like protein
MRILVADDDVLTREILETVLRARRHDVLVAADGDEAWRVFRAGRPEVVISDWRMPGLDGPGLVRRIREAGGAAAYVILLTAHDEPARLREGMLAGADDYLTKPLDLAQLEARLIAASRVTALHARLAAREAELERLNDALALEARRDPLTGLWNRLRLGEDLAVAHARAERYDQGYALALLDVDRFKAFNDRFGHQAGDEALRAVARTLAREARGGDACYRYGGEEVLVLLPAQPPAGAAAAVRRLAAAVAGLAIAHPGNVPAGIVTVSAGVTIREGGPGPGADDVLRRADAALYDAKDAGRNRIVVDVAAAVAA